MDALTNPGLVYDQGQGTDPTSGMSVQLPPIVKYFKNAALRGHQAALDEMATVQPGTSSITGPDSGPALIPQPGQPDQSQATDSAAPASSMPKMFKPSFSQVTTDAQGLPAPINPAETKLGKLVHILAAAGQGALAGWGQMNPAAGSAMAREVPFQQAEQRQQLAQQQAQLALTRSQSQMVPTPYGPMPAGMARVVFPAAIRAGATTGAAQIGAQSRENVAGTAAQGREAVANINKGTVIVPGKGLYQKDQTGQYQPVQGAQVPNILITPDEATAMGHPELANQELPIDQYAQMQRGTAFGSVPVEGENGPALVQRNPASPNYGKVTPLGLGNPSLGHAVQVSDPTNPGNITYSTAGRAIANAAPSPRSAPAVAATAITKSAVAGPIGNEINAFNTALQHADLLESAAKALGNGDQQTLNSLKNRFKTEFGASGPITAQTVANAYSREITKMLSGGHMTDAEISSAGGTTDVNKMSPQQMQGVLGAYKALASSKMRMRQQQVQQGQQGKPNFPTNTGLPQGATHIVPGPDGRNHYTNDLGTVDLGVAP